MFLSEVALGKEHHIKADNWRLTCAPKGYDSIVARGYTEPGLHHGSVFLPFSVPIRLATMKKISAFCCSIFVYKTAFVFIVLSRSSFNILMPLY